VIFKVFPLPVLPPPMTTRDPFSFLFPWDFCHFPLFLTFSPLTWRRKVISAKTGSLPLLNRTIFPLLWPLSYLIYFLVFQGPPGDTDGQMDALKNVVSILRFFKVKSVDPLSRTAGRYSSISPLFRLSIPIYSLGAWYVPFSPRTVFSGERSPPCLSSPFLTVHMDQGICPQFLHRGSLSIRGTLSFLFFPLHNPFSTTTVPSHLLRPQHLRIGPVQRSHCSHFESDPTSQFHLWNQPITPHPPFCIGYPRVPIKFPFISLFPVKFPSFFFISLSADFFLTRPLGLGWPSQTIASPS